MPRYAFQSHFTDGNGMAVLGGTVTVYLTGTSTLATIYEYESGSAISGSQITTSTSDGSFKFFVDTDDYSPTQRFRVVLSHQDFTTRTYDDVAIFPYIFSGGTTGGTGSAGLGKQYVELTIGANTYKILHDGTV